MPRFPLSLADETSAPSSWWQHLKLDDVWVGLTVALIGWGAAKLFDRWNRARQQRKKDRELWASGYLVSAAAFYGPEVMRFHQHPFIEDRVQRRAPFGTQTSQSISHPVQRQIEEWIKGDQPFAVLFGPSGVGKTRSLIEAARGTPERQIFWINLAQGGDDPTRFLAELERFPLHELICACDELQRCPQYEKLVGLFLRKKGRLLVVARDKEAAIRPMGNPDPFQVTDSKCLSIPLGPMAPVTLNRVAEARAGFDRVVVAGIPLATISKLAEGLPVIAVLAVDYYAQRKTLTGIDNTAALFDSFFDDLERQAKDQWLGLQPVLGELALIRGGRLPANLSSSERAAFGQWIGKTNHIVKEERANELFFRIQPTLLSEHIVQKVFFSPDSTFNVKPVIKAFLATHANDMLWTLISCGRRAEAEFLLENARILPPKTVLALGLTAYASYRDMAMVQAHLGEFWKRPDTQYDATDYGNLGRLLSVFSTTDEAETCWKNALEICAAAGDRVRRGAFLIELGQMYSGRKRWEAAARVYDEALTVGRELEAGEKASAIATVRNNLASLYADQGNVAMAREQIGLARRSLDGQSGSQVISRIRGITELTAGHICFLTRNLDEGIKSYEEAVGFFGSDGGIDGTAVAFVGLSLTYGAKGDWRKAQEYLVETERLPGFFGDTRILAKAYLQFGDMHRGKNDWASAESCYDTAKKHFAQLGDWQGMAAAEQGLGWMYIGRSNWVEAEEAFNAAQRLSRRFEDESGLAATYLGLGAIDHAKANWDDSIRHYETALEIFQGLGLKNDAALATINLGAIDWARGNDSSARSKFETAHALFKHLGDAAGCAIAEIKLGSLAVAESDWTQAEGLYRESLATAQRLGASGLISDAMLGLASIQKSQGNWNQAEAMYREALGLAESLRNQMGILDAHLCLGSVYLKSARWADSVAAYRAGYALSESLGSDEGRAAALSGVAEALADEGQWDRAAAVNREALAIYVELGTRRQIATIHREFGWISYRKGDFAGAIEETLLATNLFRAMDDPFGLASATSNLASIHASIGKLAEALQGFDQCELLYRKTNNLSSLVNILNSKSLLCIKLGRYADAAELCETALVDARKLKARLTESYLLTNQGTALVHLLDWARAEKCFSLGLAIKHDLKDLYGIAWSEGEIGMMNLKRQVWPEAEAHLKVSFESFNSMGALGDARRIGEALSSLASIYRQNGQAPEAANIMQFMESAGAS